jgi:hypothetical protein
MKVKRKGKASDTLQKRHDEEKTGKTQRRARKDQKE